MVKFINEEYTGLDAKAMCMLKDEVCYRHLQNSLYIVKKLEEKRMLIDYTFQRKCIEARDYAALEMYVVELMIKGERIYL